MERRQIAIQTEFKTREDGDKLMIAGYFAVYNQNYEICNGISESIKSGAFDKVLADNPDVRALINHDSTLVLGRTTAGTLRLKSDNIGLYGEIDINPNDTDAMNLYNRVKRGDVNQCSFGFDIAKESTEYRDDGSIHFSIEEIAPLYEVSPCTFPAYEATAIEARQKDAENAKSRSVNVYKEKTKERLENLNA